jgi:hypothetical protein
MNNIFNQVQMIFSFLFSQAFFHFFSNCKKTLKKQNNKTIFLKLEEKPLNYLDWIG